MYKKRDLSRSHYRSRSSLFADVNTPTESARYSKANDLRKSMQTCERPHQLDKTHQDVSNSNFEPVL